MQSFTILPLQVVASAVVKQIDQLITLLAFYRGSGRLEFYRGSGRLEFYRGSGRLEFYRGSGRLELTVATGACP